MESIEKHIKQDQEILDNPLTSPHQRRHVEGELHELEVYAENHKKEIEAGDHHDPTALEIPISPPIKELLKVWEFHPGSWGENVISEINTNIPRKP